MFRPEIEHLLALAQMEKARFHGAQSRYDSFASDYVQRVARVEWSLNPRHSVYPFGLEREEFKPSQVLKTPPKVTKGKYCYGLADDGRVLYEHRYTEFEGRKYEEFREYESGRISTTLYDYHEPDKGVINVQALLLVDSIPTGFIRYARNGLSVESYEYEKGLLVTSYGASQEHNPKSPRHNIILTSDSFVYDKGSLKEVIRSWGTGGRERLYPRRKNLDP